MYRPQDIMQLLAQLTGPRQRVRALAPTQLRQSGGSRRFDQSGQFNEHHQVSVGYQSFDWPVEGPLVQGVDQVERGMTATPIEFVHAVRHDHTCPVHWLFVDNLY